MRKIHLLLAALVAVAPAPALAAPAEVAEAVATSERDADNVKLDEGRKPAEVLAFLGLEQGMRVLDVAGGNRYWAEIIAPAVVPGGHLTVWQPRQFMSEKGSAAFAAFTARQPNVTLLLSPFEMPQVGTGLYDFVLINLDYHDVYWQSEQFKISRMEPDAWVRRIFAAAKPGAVVGVIDHVAAAGREPRESVEKDHRIDPAIIRADFERAGFVLEEQSDLLRNPADDHTVNVFDPAIRGRTDRVIFRFRKPA